MRRTVGVFELEYRIDLPGVPALEVDDCSSCLQGIGRRSLVAAVKQSAGENETRGESQKTNESRHGSQRISGACKEDSDECPFWAEPRRLNAHARAGASLGQPVERTRIIQKTSSPRGMNCGKKNPNGTWYGPGSSRANPLVKPDPAANVSPKHMRHRWREMREAPEIPPARTTLASPAAAMASTDVKP